MKKLTTLILASVFFFAGIALVIAADMNADMAAGAMQAGEGTMNAAENMMNEVGNMANQAMENADDQSGDSYMEDMGDMGSDEATEPGNKMNETK